MSSVARTAAMKGLRPKTTTLLLLFLLLEAKCHLIFCWLQLAAVDVTAFLLLGRSGSSDHTPALQWDPRLS